MSELTPQEWDAEATRLEEIAAAWENANPHHRAEWHSDNSHRCRFLVGEPPEQAASWWRAHRADKETLLVGESTPTARYVCGTLADLIRALGLEREMGLETSPPPEPEPTPEPEPSGIDPEGAIASEAEELDGICVWWEGLGHAVKMRQRGWVVFAYPSGDAVVSWYREGDLDATPLRIFKDDPGYREGTLSDLRAALEAAHAEATKPEPEPATQHPLMEAAGFQAWAQTPSPTIDPEPEEGHNAWKAQEPTLDLPPPLTLDEALQDLADASHGLLEAKAWLIEAERAYHLVLRNAGVIL